MHKILLYFTFFLGVMPFLLYVFLRYWKVSTKAHAPAVPFLWLSLIGSLYEPIVTLSLKIDSLYWFRFYNVLEFLCIYYFFWTLLHKRYKLLFKCFLSFFTVGSIAVVVCDIAQLKVESIYSPFIFFVVIIFSALWFGDISGNAKMSDKFRNPAIIFTCGFLLYYSGTLFFYLLSEAILIDSKVMGYQDYWLVNIIATLVLKIFLIAGVWNGRKR